MKKNLITKNCVVALLLTAGLIAASCVKTEHDGPSGGDLTGPIFDFTTRTASTLVVQYDVPRGYQVYFEVYTENPIYLGEDGQILRKTDVKPIDAGFTDANGRYNERLSVMSTTDQIYIYSPYAGVPNVLVADVKAGGITEARMPVVADAQRATRAEDYEYYNKMYGDQLHTLGIWRNADSYMLNGVSYRQFGRPDNVLKEKIEVSSDLLNLISQTLPEATPINPELIKNGNVNIVKETTIDLFLIDEVTGALNTLAYYCYDTNNPPSSKDAVKDVVIAFPNIQVFKLHELNSLPGLQGNTGAVEKGEGVRLHYWKDGKDMGEKFPANTSIGWVLYSGAYQPAAWGNAMQTPSGARVFSNGAFNYDSKEHCALFRSGDMVIMGFEDFNFGDYDYNDMALNIKANPMDAIIPGIPDVDPEPPTEDKVVSETTYRGILTFEDVWPYRGDFDMNDVVVSYESTVGYNINNEVLQTTDKFTVMHSGAQFDNSFAYQMNVLRSDADITISSSRGGDGGAYVDAALDKATVRLANNIKSYANLPTKAVFDVVSKFKGTRLSKSDFINPPYNPFITTTQKDIEVHLTNHQPTEGMNKDLLGTGHDRSEPNRNLYYVTFDDQGIQMPFAIDIVFDSNESMSKFIVTEETKRIDTRYPGFLNWVKTNGKENKDWYLKPRE